MTSLMANKVKKNMFLVSIKLFIIRTILCGTVQTFLFIRYSYHTTSLDLRNGDLQTTTVFFTRNFTQGWQNSYWLLPALSCIFICASMFVFSLSRELYSDFIIACCVFAYVYPLFSCWCCCWFTSFWFIVLMWNDIW